MAYLLMNRPEPKRRPLAHKVAGGGLAAAVLAALLLGLLPDTADKTTQLQRSMHEPFDLRQRVSEFEESPAEPLILATADDSIAIEPELASTPEFATTQPLSFDLPPESVPVDGPLLPMDSDAGPSAQPTNNPSPRPPAIASAPPGGFGRPFTAGPPSWRPPAVGGSPRRNGPTSGGPGSPNSPPGTNGPKLAGPDSPSAPAPFTPPATSTPGNSGPVAPIASTPNGPSNGPEPVDLPGDPTGPVVASGGPGDDWFSPGHSPGTAFIDGDFALNGGTLLFEILGTEAGLEYDQLIVDGKVDLNDGNVVIAFIDNFVPQASDLFELILADLIELSDSVNFYYGFFDPAVDPLWALHAPTNLSMYTQWDINSGITMGVYEQADQTGERFTVQYGASNSAASLDSPETKSGPDEDIQPLVIGATVPVPAPLLLIAAGILLTGLVRRKA